MATETEVHTQIVANAFVSNREVKMIRQWYHDKWHYVVQVYRRDNPTVHEKRYRTIHYAPYAWRFYGEVLANWPDEPEQI